MTRLHKIALAVVAVFLCYSDAAAQLASPNASGPFAESIDRRQREQDLRSLPQKLRDRLERNFSDPRTLKQMNEDFLRIQAIRAEMAAIFQTGSTISPEQLKTSSGEVRRRAIRLRSLLVLSEEETDAKLKSDNSVSLKSVNERAFQLCLEISRFTGNPLFKTKGVITVAHAREASKSLDMVIDLAAIVQKESARLDNNE